MDTISTSAGNLVMTFIGHGTLMFRFNDLVIHIDPVGRYADYATQPEAGLILVTHGHGDHFDEEAIARIRTPATAIVANPECAARLESAESMKNNDTVTVQGIPIRAVPAYNIKHMRNPGEPFHPKGTGNGYVLTFGDKRVYVAGDTENIPDMSELEDIHIAFLPMNLPYTMTPEMVAEAARRIRPAILYPYHYGSTDTSILVDLLKEEEGIEVRIRDLQ